MEFRVSCVAYARQYGVAAVLIVFHRLRAAIGRILASLRTRQLLIEPQGVRVRQRCTVPGMERRQFTVSRCAVLYVRSTTTATTAAAFLDERCTRVPVPVQAIRVDGGSEFIAEFELACRQKEIPLYVLPPLTTKLNGRVERLNASFVANAGSATTVIWTSPRSSRHSAIGKLSTMPNVRIKRSRTRLPTSSSPRFLSHMYQTRATR